MPFGFLRWIGLAIAALVGGLVATAPASAQVNSRITCESWQFRPAQCAVPNTIDARISRVIAGDCRPGNWGYDRSGVWVNNGCRAVFDVATRGNSGGGWGGSGGGGGGNSGGGQFVRCESWQFQPARCNMDTRGGVRIQRVIAGDCRQNQTWGFDRNAVWVNGGCRADFASASGGGGNNGGGWGGSGGNTGGGGGYGQIVECSSWEFRPARCAVRVQTAVQIDRVNGGECVQGRTWGWDRNGIWVNDGCRARFRVY